MPRTPHALLHSLTPPDLRRQIKEISRSRKAAEEAGSFSAVAAMLRLETELQDRLAALTPKDADLADMTEDDLVAGLVSAVRSLPVGLRRRVLAEVVNGAGSGMRIDA
jgi:hypothetical protein